MHPTTDVILIFLASKAVVLAAATLLIGVKPLREWASGLLSGPQTNPARLLEAPKVAGRKRLP